MSCTCVCLPVLTPSVPRVLRLSCAFRIVAPSMASIAFRFRCFFPCFPLLPPSAIILSCPIRGAVVSYRWAFLTCLEFALSVLFDNVASSSILAFLSLAPCAVRFSCIGGLSSLALSFRRHYSLGCCFHFCTVLSCPFHYSFTISPIVRCASSSVTRPHCCTDFTSSSTCRFLFPRLVYLFPCGHLCASPPVS